jgi:hypothetical protein
MSMSMEDEKASRKKSSYCSFNFERLKQKKAKRMRLKLVRIKMKWNKPV